MILEVGKRIANGRNQLNIKDDEMLITVYRNSSGVVDMSIEHIPSGLKRSKKGTKERTIRKTLMKQLELAVQEITNEQYIR